MSVNLISMEPLDNFLSGFLSPIQCSYTPTISFARNGSLKTKSVQQIERNKEYIAKSMVERYFDHRIKAFLLANENAPYFEKIGYSDYMEDWAKKRISNGQNVYVFCKDKMPKELIEDIASIRDFLYHLSLKKVEDKVELFNNTQKRDKEISIKLDTLKNTNEYADFESLLAAAKNGEVYKRKAAEFLRESLYDTESVMQFDDNMQIVRLKSKIALNFEGREMSHCVGDGEYDQDGNKQKIDIFSLRDPKGHPHVTIELRDGVLRQCKAYDNRKPNEQYLPHIREFVKANDLEISSDMKYLGMFKQDGQYYSYDALPKGFVYKGMLDLSGIGLEKLPNMSHIEVTGSFVCENNFLTNFVGAPRKVGGNVYASNNQFKSLKGAPEYVGGDFYCTHGQMKNLLGAPKIVEGTFCCVGNELTTLKGAPEFVGGTFDCSGNMLTDLEGSPRVVGENFDCSRNNLVTLKGAPDRVGKNFDCSNNELHSLEHLPKEIGGEIIYHKNYILCQDGKYYDLTSFPKDVVIKGSVDLSGMGLKRLPDLSGVVVEGDFICSDNELESLDGSPKTVKGTFDCSGNKIKNILFAPKEIGGDFIFSNNKIETLANLPIVSGEVLYDGNPVIRSIIEGRKHMYRDFVIQAMIEEKRCALPHLEIIDGMKRYEKAKNKKLNIDVFCLKEMQDSKLK